MNEYIYQTYHKYVSEQSIEEVEGYFKIIYQLKCK